MMARMIVVVQADLEVKRYIFAHHPMHLSLLPVFSKKSCQSSLRSLHL